MQPLAAIIAATCYTFITESPKTKVVQTKRIIGYVSCKNIAVATMAGFFARPCIHRVTVR